jgi:hypothetical protein
LYDLTKQELTQPLELEPEVHRRSTMTGVSDSASFSATPRPTLRLPVLVAIGVFFWLLAAMMIRFLGPTVLVPGSLLLPVAFALGLPIAWAFVWAGTFLAGARGAAVLPAMVVMSFTAMLLDGIALTWFPALYGPTYALGGAYILWGLGLIQFIAFVQTQRRQ